MSVCSVEVCDREALALGWCSGHYWRYRRTGEPGTTPIAPKREPKINLPEPRSGKPYTGTEICLVEVCDRPVDKRGLCSRHYKRFLVNGTPGVTAIATRKPFPEVCAVEGCLSTKIHAREMCRKHYCRYMRGTELRCENQVLPNLRKRREELGIGFSQFAWLAGITENCLHRAERGAKIHHTNVAKIITAVARIQSQRRKVGVVS